MCGIVAAVADRNIVPVLLEGLRRLEYRGYDSAGVAFLQGRDLISVKAEGKLGNLALLPERAAFGDFLDRYAEHG